MPAGPLGSGPAGVPAPMGLRGTDGELPKRSTGTDCKSVGFGLRRFESYTRHFVGRIRLDLRRQVRAGKRVWEHEDLLNQANLVEQLG